MPEYFAAENRATGQWEHPTTDRALAFHDALMMQFKKGAGNQQGRVVLVERIAPGHYRKVAANV